MFARLDGNPATLEKFTTVCELAADGIHPIEAAAGTCPLKASAGYRQKQAKDVDGWYQSIIADGFG